MFKKSCASCVKFSSRFSTDFEGTCVLDGVYVASSHVCDRWVDSKSNSMDFHFTTGADHLFSPADEGTVVET